MPLHRLPDRSDWRYTSANLPRQYNLLPSYLRSDPLAALRFEKHRTFFSYSAYLRYRHNRSLHLHHAALKNIAVQMHWLLHPGPDSCASEYNFYGLLTALLIVMVPYFFLIFLYISSFFNKIPWIITKTTTRLSMWWFVSS